MPAAMIDCCLSYVLGFVFMGANAHGASHCVGERLFEAIPIGTLVKVIGAIYHHFVEPVRGNRALCGITSHDIFVRHIITFHVSSAIGAGLFSGESHGRKRGHNKGHTHNKTNLFLHGFPPAVFCFDFRCSCFRLVPKTLTAQWNQPPWCWSVLRFISFRLGNAQQLNLKVLKSIWLLWFFVGFMVTYCNILCQ